MLYFVCYVVFTASFGGLLSLLLGFTLIAGFDLIIFFCFDVVCRSVAGFKKQKENNKRPNNIKRGSKGNKIYVREYPPGFTGKAVNYGKW